MQAVKIRKIGNSLGVVIPKEVLARMKVAEGETVYFTETGDGGVRLTPLDESFSEEFALQMAAAEKLMRQDRHILRELAKR
ncbi:MAG: AbrB/MazE/SpoVT family DNA-binding domain-containing protein [Humidesulfovibrio sp.]|jgi:putative addiction module antidote|uniref:AbrB/MazE/SpoVT family DNA-binding domain-containing protein n=1 Tax=Humidesulfovibrio sp. TaxID=2910988 RepID=UPI0027364015|nr:AbrB/MazE/SpoVT family DNA-binding domain-containing protein [Humidesulfovibrio sp.]MDP2848194.1 AbrB/MazE/SpoVT family DNA-binding domain-containing protein [Humidesulfovibrio sp.]